MAKKNANTSTRLITETRELQPFLGELLNSSWLSSIARVMVIEGGVVNQNFRVMDGQREYFLKCFDDRASQLCRSSLYQLQQWLAQHKLTPKPLLLSEKRQFQLEQWVAPSVDHSQPLSLTTLANALHRLHQLTPPINQLQLPAVWQRYLSVIPSPSPDVLRDIACFSEYWDKQVLDTFAHHDLQWCHVLRAEPLCLIDFEYAAYSTPAFDLASTIVANALTQEQGKRLCQEYAKYRERCAIQLEKQVQQMLPLVQLTHSLWYQSVGIVC